MSHPGRATPCMTDTMSHPPSPARCRTPTPLTRGGVFGQLEEHGRRWPPPADLGHSGVSPAGDAPGPLSPALRPRDTCLHVCERVCACGCRATNPTRHRVPGVSPVYPSPMRAARQLSRVSSGSGVCWGRPLGSGTTGVSYPLHPIPVLIPSLLSCPRLFPVPLAQLSLRGTAASTGTLELSRPVPVSPPSCPFLCPHAVPSGLPVPCPAHSGPPCPALPVPSSPSCPLCPFRSPPGSIPSLPLSPPTPSPLSHPICPNAFPPSTLSLPPPALSPLSPPLPLVLFCRSHPDPPVPSDPLCPTPCLVPSGPPCPAFPVPSHPLQSPSSHPVPPVPLRPHPVPTVPVLPRLPVALPCPPPVPLGHSGGPSLARGHRQRFAPGGRRDPRGGPAPLSPVPAPRSPSRRRGGPGCWGGPAQRTGSSCAPWGPWPWPGITGAGGRSLAPVPSRVRWHPGLGTTRNESGGRWGRQSR